LITALRAAGYETRVIHRWGGPLEQELTQLANSGRRDPLRFARAAVNRSRVTAPVASKLDTAAAHYCIRRFSPDIVWCNTVVTWRYARAATQLGVPSVLYAHEQSEWKNQPLTEFLRTSVSGPGRPTVRLVACSGSAASALADLADDQSLAESVRRIDVLHSPVDVGDVVQRGSSAFVGSPQGRRRIVACGTADHRKGFDVFVDAARLSQVDLPDAIWMWVGSPPTESLELPTNVSLLGEMPDAVPYLAGADVVVCPSRRDSFPLVVLEAMALGRPIVASDIPGPAEQLGDAGVLVTPGDASALSRAVTELLRAPAEAQRTGSLAAERCAALWGLDHFDEQVASLSQSALRMVSR